MVDGTDGTDGTDRADPAQGDPVFTATVSDGVCRLARPGLRVLSTGFDGGERLADAVYNVTVPEGWDDGGTRNLRAYVDDRLAAAGLEPDPTAPALLTGVAQRHARRARLESVEVVATAGLSNPAALPITGAGTVGAEGGLDTSEPGPTGTVNLLVGTTRDLSPGALANLVAVAAEAKAATLLALTGFPGTTSDAVVVGCDPTGEPAAFSGSATPVGAATRACVRDAVAASRRSRYGEGTDATLPTSVADATYGVVTDDRAEVCSLSPDDSPSGG